MKLLIVCGPTATGKTDLAAGLAKQFSGSLISADSRQVYQGMDIVTGKDRPTGVEIWGYDIVGPDEEFSVAHFVKLARMEIDRIGKKEQLPIVVGGTGFWLKALTEPIATIEVKPNWSLRKRLEKFSAGQLLNQLKKIDPERAARMNQSDKNNPRRLIRAIEVGKLPVRSELPVKYDCLWLGLKASLPFLDKRIEARVKDRIKAGAIKEWEKLKNSYGSDLPSMTGIGYRELPDVERWITAEKQYVRRQLTWFKKQNAINWFDVGEPGFEVKVVEKVRNWYTS